MHMRFVLWSPLFAGMGCAEPTPDFGTQSGTERTGVRICNGRTERVPWDDTRVGYAAEDVWRWLEATPARLEVTWADGGHTSFVWDWSREDAGLWAVTYVPLVGEPCPADHLILHLQPVALSMPGWMFEHYAYVATGSADLINFSVIARPTGSPSPYDFRGTLDSSGHTEGSVVGSIDGETAFFGTW
jgi:hypothetical protein